MQTIGATFKANALPGYNKDIYDPLSNILAGLRYIQRRYGSIFNVQQANKLKAARGYDNGGPLAPGYTLAYNGTGANEYVFTGNQMKELGGGCNHTTKVYVDGVEVAHRAIVEKNNRNIIMAARRGRKGGR
jgi:SLT domain-containing protein